MARKEGLRFLGSLPVDTDLVTLLDAAESSEHRPEAIENGSSFVLLNKYQKTQSSNLFKPITAAALEGLTASA